MARFVRLVSGGNLSPALTASCHPLLLLTARASRDPNSGEKMSESLEFLVPAHMPNVLGRTPPVIQRATASSETSFAPAKRTLSA